MFNQGYGFAAAVTPSDSVDLSAPAQHLFVGGAGAVVVDMDGDGRVPATTVTFTGVVAGTVLPIRVRRVRATGTTATLIVALW